MAASAWGDRCGVETDHNLSATLEYNAALRRGDSNPAPPPLTVGGTDSQSGPFGTRSESSIRGAPLNADGKPPGGLACGSFGLSRVHY